MLELKQGIGFAQALHLMELDRPKAWCFDRRTDAAMRWPPKDGQPASTLAAASAKRAERQAPAAACIPRECASGATNGKGDFMTCSWRGLTFDLSGLPKAGPLEGRVGRHLVADDACSMGLH